MTDLTATELNARAGSMLQEVLRRTHLSAAPALATVVAEEARALGADALVLYIIDYEQKSLVPVPGPGAAGREPLSVQGTVAGRAFASGSIVDMEADGRRGRRLWLPLLDGTERLGVMELMFPGQHEPLPRPIAAQCERYAHLIATLMATKDA